MKSTWADISKAESMLEWKPEIDIKEGVLKCVEWYQQNQSWLKDIKL
jgi:dTDP-D-glucose 4,6-dehydratase